MRARPVRRRVLPGARASDAERVTIAESLQLTCPRWMVMFSRWRQTYTAFACFTREPVIVDEAKADALLERIKQVELANSVADVPVIDSPLSRT